MVCIKSRHSVVQCLNYSKVMIICDTEFLVDIFATMLCTFALILSLCLTCSFVFVSFVLKISELTFSVKYQSFF